MSRTGLTPTCLTFRDLEVRAILPGRELQQPTLFYLFA